MPDMMSNKGRTEFMRNDSENVGGFSDHSGGYYLIPAMVMNRMSVSAKGKCLYGVILSLSCQKGYCFASNRRLSELIGVKNGGAFRQVLNELESVGFIRKDGKGRARHIFINNPPDFGQVDVFNPPDSRQVSNDNTPDSRQVNDEPARIQAGNTPDSRHHNNIDNKVTTTTCRCGIPDDFARFYEREVQKITDKVADKLNELCTKYGVTWNWVYYAIDAAIDQDKDKAKNFRYLGGILRNWKKSGSLEPWKSDTDNRQEITGNGLTVGVVEKTDTEETRRQRRENALIPELLDDIGDLPNGKEGVV